VSDAIISRELIRSQADAAAARWATNPSQPKPKNPYIETDAPQAHAVWEHEFPIAVLRHSAKEGGVL
jgi:hypothetical protein